MVEWRLAWWAVVGWTCMSLAWLSKMWQDKVGLGMDERGRCDLAWRGGPWCGRHLPSLHRRRQTRQMARSSQIWSRPCWAVGRRQPCRSCWKNSWRLKVAIVDPHRWMNRWIDLAVKKLRSRGPGTHHRHHCRRLLQAASPASCKAGTSCGSQGSTVYLLLKTG